MATADSKIVLYAERFWYSPYGFTAYVALEEKGLPFETRVLDLDGGDQKKPEYRDRSLTARIPSIEHGGFSLSESTAIVEYLDEVFPTPRWPRLLPEDVRERARARQVMGWIRSDMLALREERSTATMFFAKANSPLGPAAKSAAEKLLFVADRLISDERSSLFAAWSIADADLAFILHRLILNGDSVPERVKRYAEAQWKRPSVRAFVEHERAARPGG
jgi:glutathione S-transferase